MTPHIFDDPKAGGDEPRRRVLWAWLRSPCLATENGKVQKYKLRERGVTQHTWDGGPRGQKAGRRTCD